MEMVIIVDLLNKKMQNEHTTEDKKAIKNLINKINSCAFAPLNSKHSLRMLPFSMNVTVYDVVLEIIENNKIWELYSHTGVRMYDAKGYWYMIILLLHNLSDKAEQVITEIIDKIDRKYDYGLMLRMLGFFDNDNIAKMKARLENRIDEIIFE